MIRKPLAVRSVLVAGVALAMLALGSPADAARTPTSKVGGSSSSLRLVLLNSTDGLPHRGEWVTFTVSTTATSEPNVSLTCTKSGMLVYSAEAGFYPSYPWPWNRLFLLSSPSWTGGAASCTAVLYYFSGRKTVTLTTLSFQVYA